MVSPERHTGKSNNSIVKGMQQTMFLSLPALVRAFDSMYLLHFLIARQFLLLLQKSGSVCTKPGAETSSRTLCLCHWVSRIFHGCSASEKGWETYPVMSQGKQWSQQTFLPFIAQILNLCFLTICAILKDLRPMFEHSGFKISVKSFLNVLLAEVARLWDLCTNTKLGQLCLSLCFI